MKTISKKIKGSVLLESMIAISLITVGLIGIVSFLSSSIRTSKDISQRFTAAYLAAEGIEAVKYEIEKNYQEKKVFDAGSCIDVSCRTIVTPGSSVMITEGSMFLNSLGDFFEESGTGKGYSRQVFIESGEDNIHVFSAVTWGVSGAQSESKEDLLKNAHTIIVEDTFWNWYPDIIATP